MEEASTIFKAVEKAWLRAEKPQSFSVKVLEDAEKNFFGMTTKSAKIALLFEEGSLSLQPKTKEAVQSPTRRPAQAPQPQPREQQQVRRPQQEQPRSREQQPRATEQQPRELREQREQRPARFEKKPEQPQTQQEQNGEAQASSAVWAPEISTAAQNWMQGMVSSLDKDITFTSSIKNNQLVIEFNKPLIENGRDRMLFSSLAHLMMQSIRHEFKNQTRGLKVILKLQN